MKQSNEYTGSDPYRQNRTTTGARTLLTLEEAARFLRLKKSYLYNLTYTKKIPFYKCGGRKLAFDRADLQEWQAARLQYVPTQAEQAARAAAYCAVNPLKR